MPQQTRPTGKTRWATGQDSLPSEGIRVLLTSGSAELYGSDRVALETAEGLLRDGNRVVFAAGADGPLHERMRMLGAQTIIQPCPVLRRSYVSPRGLVRFGVEVARTVPGMVSTMLRLRPDVVYANTLTLPAWSLVARLCGRPVVVHVHEAEAGQARPIRRLLATTLRIASTVVFNSETSRELATADVWGRLPESVVVLNPVPRPSHVTPARTRLDGDLRLVYIGRVSARKGADLAVEAVALLTGAGHSATLDVVGDVFPGYEEFFEELRRRAESPDLAGRITFHGFNADVGSFLADSDIALVPSRSDESFGNVVIETVLAGRPVVVADQKGLREASAGLESVVLVPPGDADALAVAVRGIVANWDRARLKAAEAEAIATSRHDPMSYRKRINEVVRSSAR